MTRGLRSALADLPEPDRRAADEVRRRAAQVLRPSGALQRLDEVAVHVGAWQSTPTPSVRRPAILVFAADHGIAASGDVSAYPADVTTAMLAAVRAGRATINVMARSIGATLEVFDVGVGDPTGDIRTDAALSPDRFDAVVSTAADAVDAVADSGADLIVLGELGIGNTTVSAALTARLIGGPVDTWVGRGTGVDDDGLERKRTAVQQAVRRIAGVVDPFEILREVGGSELVGMAAAAVAARHRSIPVVLDGYICTASMLPLHAADPTALDHCIVGHCSAEPGHRLLLDRLDKRPLLDLDMRLGEGSGAMAAVPLVKMACAGVVDVATFDEWFGPAG